MAVKLICGSEFLHIPKTGGSWVTSVLEANGLVSRFIGDKHADFDRNLLRESSYISGRQHLREVFRLARQKGMRLFSRSRRRDTVQLFRFCFVRHPLSWYESWWKYMKARGWNDWGTQNSAAGWHTNSMLNGLGSDDFNEFVWNVVRARPGYVSELYFSYTKAGIGFIGKTESLRDDLAYVLDLLGHDYARDTIYTSKPTNASKTEQSRIQWDADLRTLVMKLELSALVHFDYLSDDEKRDLGIDSSQGPNKMMHPGCRRAAS